MKTCTSCQVDKPETEFYRKKTRLQAHCKQCQNERSRRHYRENKQYYRDKKRRYMEDFIEWYRTLKEGPCADCDKAFHHAAMDWDHLEGKEMSVSALAAYGNRRRVVEEIAKCDLVCSNCHRVRTFERGASSINGVMSLAVTQVDAGSNPV